MLRPWNLVVPTFPTLRREMEELLSELPDVFPRLNLSGGRILPSMNLWEDAEHIYAEAELPGFAKDEIEIHVKDDELTLRGKRKVAERPGATLLRQERGAVEFERTIALPVTVESEAVEATLRDGVLTITMPKTKAARTRKIEVRSA
jgi:HSP20 family protein